MDLVFKIILGFLAFSAVAMLFASLIGLTIWILIAFVRALEPDDTGHR
jgi:hypothetical protein